MGIVRDFGRMAAQMRHCVNRCFTGGSPSGRVAGRPVTAPAAFVPLETSPLTQRAFKTTQRKMVIARAEAEAPVMPSQQKPERAKGKWEGREPPAASGGQVGGKTNDAILYIDGKLVWEQKLLSLWWEDVQGEGFAYPGHATMMTVTDNTALGWKREDGTWETMEHLSGIVYIQSKQWTLIMVSEDAKEEAKRVAEEKKKKQEELEAQAAEMKKLQEEDAAQNAT